MSKAKKKSTPKPKKLNLNTGDKVTLKADSAQGDAAPKYEVVRIRDASGIHLCNGDNPKESELNLV